VTSVPPSLRVPIFDGAAETVRDLERLREAAERVLTSGHYILGPEVSSFEADVARYVGAGTGAVSCASGTDALWLALRALEVRPGDAVVVPDFTFFATASAVLQCGATPVFCDIDADTFNISTAALEAIFEGRSDPHRDRGVEPRSIRAVIAVHLFGQPADMDDLLRITGRYGVPLIEDAAQAFGARFGEQRVGTLAAVGCFSFFPTKNLGGFGDGGMVVTTDPKVEARLRLLRAHGSARKYEHQIIGTNSRLDELQAALLRVRLRSLDARLADRAAIADVYDAELPSDRLRVPVRKSGRDHTFNQYVVRFDEGRDEIARSLREDGIGTAVHYPLPVHLQPAVEGLGYARGDFPTAEAACRAVLSLPMYPSLERSTARHVADRIRTA